MSRLPNDLWEPSEAEALCSAVAPILPRESDAVARAVRGLPAEDFLRKPLQLELRLQDLRTYHQFAAPQAWAALALDWALHGPEAPCRGCAIEQGLFAARMALIGYPLRPTYGPLWLCAEALRPYRQERCSKPQHRRTLAEFTFGVAEVQEEFRQAQAAVFELTDQIDWLGLDEVTTPTPKTTSQFRELRDLRLKLQAACKALSGWTEKAQALEAWLAAQSVEP